MTSKLIVISALLCIVAADVSEILRRPSGRVALKAYHLRTNNHKLKARENDGAEIEPQPFDTVFIEDPVDLELEPLALVLDETDAPASFQLHESHPDFQGPYHYKKPAVENDYLAPKPDGDYLPPHGPRDTANTVAKRSIKLRLRARH